MDMMQRQWGHDPIQGPQHSSLIDTEDEAKHIGSHAMDMGQNNMMQRGFSDKQNPLPSFLEKVF